MDRILGGGLFRINTNHPGTTLETLQAIISDGIISENEYYHYTKNAGDQFNPDSVTIKTIYQDREGTLWFVGNGTLYNLPYSGNREKFNQFRHGDTIRGIA